ncbi:MAG: DUF4149 domain-containing protein [Ottowia sp.]|jgi:uncharacterized membrane protein|nr:DUF4149 domain-containing protein [Ottowia sp.]
MQSRVTLFAAALWWGSLSAIGFLAVPLLFRYLPSPAMAGQTAAKLFAAQTWVTLACAIVLLLALKPKSGLVQSQPARAATILVVLGMLLAMVVEYGVAPRIVARENLRLWHSAGTLMYAVQWLCAGAVLWRLGSSSAQVKP